PAMCWDTCMMYSAPKPMNRDTAASNTMGMTNAYCLAGLSSWKYLMYSLLGSSMLSFQNTSVQIFAMMIKVMRLPRIMVNTPIYCSWAKPPSMRKILAQKPERGGTPTKENKGMAINRESFG